MLDNLYGQFKIPLLTDIMLTRTNRKLQGCGDFSHVVLFRPMRVVPHSNNDNATTIDEYKRKPLILIIRTFKNYRIITIYCGKLQLLAEILQRIEQITWLFTTNNKPHWDFSANCQFYFGVHALFIILLKQRFAVFVLSWTLFPAKYRPLFFLWRKPLTELKCFQKCIRTYKLSILGRAVTNN